MDINKKLLILMCMIFLIGIISAMPLITIDSPINSSFYQTSSVDLNFSVNESIDWCSYSLDNSANNTDIFNAYWTDWVASSITSGFAPSYEAITPSVFEYDNNWYIIAGENYGTFLGYVWTGSSWITNSTIIQGLTDVGSKPAPEVYEKDGSLNMIVASSDVDLGYTWNGTDWEINSSLVNGLTGPLGLYPSIIERNGNWYLYMGTYTAGVQGYDWNGTSWILNSSLTNGIQSDAHTTPSVFEIEGVLSLIMGGQSSSHIWGQSWNGTSWNTDSSVLSGIGSFNANTKPDVFQKDDNFYVS